MPARSKKRRGQFPGRKSRRLTTGKAYLWATARAAAFVAVGGASAETLTIATVNNADMIIMQMAFAFAGIACRWLVRSSADARDCHNRGLAVDLVPIYPLFCDMGLLDTRVGRVPENEVIALNNQGGNSRRDA